MIGYIKNTKTKFWPEFKGVDPRVSKYVDEYLRLAKENGIEFDGKVTIGFKDINDELTIAQCNYGSFFREIDIDNTIWNRHSEITRLVTILHELSHCYCDRDHDWGDGREYDKKKNDGVGFFSDGCPMSILYPVIVEDRCVSGHYDFYTKEMFHRCGAW